MPKGSNVICFSLPEETRSRLSSLANDGESLALVAKRLVLSALGDDSPQEMPPDIGDRLGEVERSIAALSGGIIKETRLAVNDLELRVGSLETAIAQQPETAIIPPGIGDRLEKIEKHLDWAKREILDQREKIKGLDSDLYHGESLSFKELRDDIKRIQTAIAQQPETAIMIQKKPIDTTPTEIVYQHSDLAYELNRTTATVKKWSKNPDLWPKGFIFDSDKSLWIKTA